MANPNAQIDLGTRLANHLVAIARALAEPPPAGHAGALLHDTLRAGRTAPAEPLKKADSDEILLSLDGAIDLGNGSQMFAGPIVENEGWAVLQGLTPANGETSTFDLKGILPAALDPVAFVTSAYLLVLDREPDQQGMHDYLPVLDGASGRAEVLRLIAASGEASRLPRHLILVPEALLAGDYIAP